MKGGRKRSSKPPTSIWVLEGEEKKSSARTRGENTITGASKGSFLEGKKDGPERLGGGKGKRKRGGGRLSGRIRK